MKTKVRPEYSSRKLNQWLPHTIAVAVFFLCVCTGRAQDIPQPVLAITAIASNQMTITITNGVSSGIYDIYTTPVLANDAAYPWTAAVIGTNGQTNFTINLGPYPAGFYRAIVDTNSVPIWAAADPSNPSAGYLAVFIDSPTDGSILTQ
jgi:hypothetical protein